MINPGGQPNVQFDQRTATRFNNTQIKAAKASMPMNQAAQNSLRRQTSVSKPAGPPMANNLAPQVAPSQAEPVEIPTGSPGLPVEAAQNFDPAVFQEHIVNELVGTIRLQNFINSPRVKDAATSVRLKNIFNASNPEKMPDSRNLLTQVLSRMGMGATDV